ncbi:MAG TPA: hypothetical protein DDX19_01765 [Rhodopirellula baltica]|uniref:Uncharacterized protein n=2 Tax=Rhodopirellula baltica TaxID=265606 RepID=Q7UW84_RHOBA|nr:hypothetical protein RBWH47_05041 [Rhodopirellula baltica WH47]CAD72484.1 hypothetical protein RB2201 [Rhodopirellula baltica SH 1]HBE61506.1 hypothetical protein [Rhodopirellula baltica]
MAPQDGTKTIERMREEREYPNAVAQIHEELPEQLQDWRAIVCLAISRHCRTMPSLVYSNKISSRK